MILVRNKTTASVSIQYLVGGKTESLILPPLAQVTIPDADSLHPSSQSLVDSGVISLNSQESPTTSGFLPLSNSTPLQYSGVWSSDQKAGKGYVYEYSGMLWVVIKDHLTAGDKLPPSASNYFSPFSLLSDSGLSGVFAGGAEHEVLIHNGITWESSTIAPESLNNIPTSKITGLDSTLGGLLPLTGGAMTGSLSLPAGSPSSSHAVRRDWSESTFVKLAGNQTLTGPLSWAGTPTSGNHLVNKSYADSLTTSFLPNSGGTVTGQITLPGAAGSGNNALSHAQANAKFLQLSGGTLTGQVTQALAPTADAHLVNKAYLTTFINSGLTISGSLKYTGAITSSTHLVTKSYVDGVAANGATITSPIKWSGTPSASNHLVNKSYVDGITGNLLPLAGGTLTGQVTQALAPTAGGHLANKAYVDGLIPSISNLLDKSGGVANAMTGELVLHLGLSSSSGGLFLDDTSKTGNLNYRWIQMLGGTWQDIVADAEVSGGFMAVDASSDPLVVSLPTILGRDMGEKLVVKTDETDNPVFLTSGDGKDANTVLREHEESISVVHGSGSDNWIKISKTNVPDKLISVDGSKSGLDVNLEIKELKLVNFVIDSVSDNGGKANFEGSSAHPFVHGEELKIVGPSNYSGDCYVIDIADGGNTIVTNLDYSGTDSFEVVGLGIVSPSALAPTQAGVILSDSASDTFSAPNSEFDITVTEGAEIIGSDQIKVINSTSLGTSVIAIDKGALSAPQEVFVHSVSSGSTHGSVRKTAIRSATNTEAFSEAYASAATHVSGTEFTLSNACGLALEAGDTVSITGDYTDASATVVSTTETTVVTDTPFTATGTGTIDASIATITVSPDTEGLNVGEDCHFEGISSLGGDSLDSEVKAIVGNSVYTRDLVAAGELTGQVRYKQAWKINFT